jgi:hypothetical protein
MMPHLRWFILKHRLYRWMPVRLAARVLLKKPAEREIEIGRRMLEERGLWK